MKKRKIIALICLGLGLTCGAIGIYKYIEEKNAGKEYEKLQQEVVKEEPKPVEEPEPEPVSKVEIPIDFAALQQQNPDVYAWIQVPGTEVDYPILQSSNDNTYYLNHTIDGEEKEGAIF